VGPARRSRFTPVLTILLLLAAFPVNTDVPVEALSPAARIDAGGSPQKNCSGRCLNPHPNQFKWWYGQRKDCQVQVFRQWTDGCTHYQWFNTCNNKWDVDSRGAARVYWTCCTH
jgi:hypothetical protein